MSDFQAEYEGSIPFTRSNDFKKIRCFLTAPLARIRRWREATRRAGLKGNVDKRGAATRYV